MRLVEANAHFPTKEAKVIFAVFAIDMVADASALFRADLRALWACLQVQSFDEWLVNSFTGLLASFCDGKVLERAVEAEDGLADGALDGGEFGPSAFALDLEAQAAAVAVPSDQFSAFLGPEF